MPDADHPSSADRSFLGSGDSHLICGCMDTPEAATSFETAQSDFHFEEMVGKNSQPLPRVQCLLHSPRSDGLIPIYRYPGNEQGDRYPSYPLGELGERVCELAEAALERQLGSAALWGELATTRTGDGSGYFNHVVVNYYRNKSDFISAHQDKRLDIEHGSIIGSLSVYPAGADPRILELLSADGQRRRTAVPLPQGSLFVLGDLTNQQYLHSVRPEGSSGSVNNKKPSASATSRAAGGGSSGSAYQQARISFTLRRCATFIDPALANGGGGRNHLVGQGAQYRMAPDGTVRPYICQLPSPKTLALLYHDSHFVAIAKPSGWSIEEPAQDAAAGSAGGSMQAEPSVLPWLREQLFLVAAERPPNHGGKTEETGGGSAISPTTVHHKFYAVAGLPVEQAVSGVVLLARSSHAAQAMAAMLAQSNAPCRATAPAIGSSSGSSQVSLMPARPDCEVSWLAAVSGVVPSSLQVTRALSKKQQPNKSARKAAARRAGKAALARERQPQQPQQSVGGGLSACCSYLPLPADLSAQNLPPPTLAPDDPPCHCTSFERVAALWEHEGAARISLLRASVRWQSAADSLQNPRRSEPMVAAAPVRHQVRRHLAGAAFPILGDSQYGKGRINRWLREEYDLTRPFLHVERLSVPHPLFIQAHCSRSGSSSGEGAHVQHPSASGQKNTGRKIDVSAELAEDLVAFLRRIPDASKTARATTADATAASPASNASDDDDGVEASTRARVLRQLGIEEE